MNFFKVEIFLGHPVHKGCTPMALRFVQFVLSGLVRILATES